MVGVFKPFHRPGRTAAEMADGAGSALERSGYGEFTLTEAALGEVPPVRLECTKHDAGRVWAVRELFAVKGDTELCLGFGTAVPDEDDPIFEAIAGRFEILDQPYGSHPKRKYPHRTERTEVRPATTAVGPH